jgi:hypothetical protein
MKYIYYIDGEKFLTDIRKLIPWDVISSPNENTPAYEDINTGSKAWCEKGQILHRLTGPARIMVDGTCQFYLNGKYYENIHDWLKDHPNQDNTFQVEMLLKYS